MTNPNRLGDGSAGLGPVADVANAETRVVPVPGQGGWTPATWVPLVLSVVVGAVVSVGSVLATAGAGPVAWTAILGALLTGAGGGAATFLGVKSAGPRKEGG